MDLAKASASKYFCISQLKETKLVILAEFAVYFYRSLTGCHVVIERTIQGFTLLIE